MVRKAKVKKEIEYGVYGIFHDSDFPIYIGETNNFKNRINAHKLKLKTGKHIKSLQKYVDENVKNIDTELEFKLIFIPKENNKLRLMMAEQILIMTNKDSVLNKPVLQFGNKYIQFSFTDWDIGILRYL